MKQMLICRISLDDIWPAQRVDNQFLSENEKPVLQSVNFIGDAVCA